MDYLKCAWCERNASVTVRIAHVDRNNGKLMGMCLEHSVIIPTETDAYGTRQTLSYALPTTR